MMDCQARLSPPLFFFSIRTIAPCSHLRHKYIFNDSEGLYHTICYRVFHGFVRSVLALANSTSCCLSTGRYKLLASCAVLQEKTLVKKCLGGALEEEEPLIKLEGAKLNYPQSTSMKLLTRQTTSFRYTSNFI